MTVDLDALERWVDERRHRMGNTAYLVPAWTEAECRALLAELRLAREFIDHVRVHGAKTDPAKAPAIETLSPFSPDYLRHLERVLTNRSSCEPWDDAIGYALIAEVRRLQVDVVNTKARLITTEVALDKALGRPAPSMSAGRCLDRVVGVAMEDAEKGAMVRVLWWGGWDLATRTPKGAYTSVNVEAMEDATKGGPVEVRDGTKAYPYPMPEDERAAKFEELHRLHAEALAPTPEEAQETRDDFDRRMFAPEPEPDLQAAWRCGPLAPYAADPARDQGAHEHDTPLDAADLEFASFDQGAHVRAFIHGGVVFLPPRCERTTYGGRQVGKYGRFPESSR